MDTLNKSKALIIRPSALGDTLLLAPALSQIADRVEITLVGRGPGVDFLRPLLHGCLEYERGGWHKLFSEWPDCRVFSFPQVDRVVSFLSDRTGEVKESFRRCLKGIPLFSFSPFPAEDRRMHVALYLASCLKESGLPVHPEQAVANARKRGVLGKGRPSGPGRRVVVHPGSGSREKNYPPEFWVDLIGGEYLEVCEERILLLGPAEEERCQYFSARVSGAGVEVVISPHKEGLVSLLNGAWLYIGHDSGVTHLAAMLGAPTIALFRNSHPFKWAPLGPDVTVIADAKDSNGIFRRIEERLHRLQELLP